jgi:hypothetical protein
LLVTTDKYTVTPYNERKEMAVSANREVLNVQNFSLGANHSDASSEIGLKTIYSLQKLFKCAPLYLTL